MGGRGLMGMMGGMRNRLLRRAIFFDSVSLISYIEANEKTVF